MLHASAQHRRPPQLHRGDAARQERAMHASSVGPPCRCQYSCWVPEKLQQLQHGRMTLSPLCRPGARPRTPTQLGPRWLCRQQAPQRSPPQQAPAPQRPRGGAALPGTPPAAPLCARTARPAPRAAAREAAPGPLQAPESRPPAGGRRPLPAHAAAPLRGPELLGLGGCNRPGDCAVPPDGAFAAALEVWGTSCQYPWQRW